MKHISLLTELERPAQCFLCSGYMFLAEIVQTEFLPVITGKEVTILERVLRMTMVEDREGGNEYVFTLPYGDIVRLHQSFSDALNCLARGEYFYKNVLTVTEEKTRGELRLFLGTKLSYLSRDKKNEDTLFLMINYSNYSNKNDKIRNKDHVIFIARDKAVILSHFLKVCATITAFGCLAEE